MADTLCRLNLPSITLLSLARSNLYIGSRLICLSMCAGLLVQMTLTVRLECPTVQSKTDPLHLVIPESPVSACKAKFPKASTYLRFGRLSSSQSRSPSQCSTSGRVMGLRASVFDERESCFLTTLVT